MNEIPELLPCPFCGAAAELRPDERGCHFIAHCTVCDGDIDNWCLGKETATAAWNTRAPDAELAGLRAESAEHLTADQIEQLQCELADIRTEFEATDSDTIRGLRAELAARDHDLQHLHEQYASLLRLPESDRRELARYTEFRKVRAALRALMAAVEHEDPKVIAEAMRLAGVVAGGGNGEHT